MRIATWNVNSLKVRLPHLVDWLARQQPDAVCLQETKCEDAAFPAAAIEAAGYRWVHDGQKTYNGVAIASRLPMRDVSVGLSDGANDPDKRLIAASVGGIRVLSAYVPNGKSVDSPSFAVKLAFFDRLAKTLLDQAPDKRGLVLCGDFNVAPDERDVFDPERMRGQLHFHPDEHRALGKLLGLGLVDAYRLHHREGGRFSWWDYRGAGFAKNEGLRIDLVLLSGDLAERCTGAHIDAEERQRDKPSDHAPVFVDLV